MLKYKVEYLQSTKDYRANHLVNVLDTVVLLEDDGQYVYLGCDESEAEIVEYEFNDAKQRDGYCDWQRIF